MAYRTDLNISEQARTGAPMRVAGLHFERMLRGFAARASAFRVARYSAAARCVCVREAEKPPCRPSPRR